MEQDVVRASWDWMCRQIGLGSHVFGFKKPQYQGLTSKSEFL
jgi:hypothetical protein